MEKSLPLYDKKRGACNEKSPIYRTFETERSIFEKMHKSELTNFPKVYFLICSETLTVAQKTFIIYQDKMA